MGEPATIRRGKKPVAQPFAFWNGREVTEREWCPGHGWMCAAHRCPGSGTVVPEAPQPVGNPIASVPPAPSGRSCSPLGAQPWEWSLPFKGALRPLRRRQLVAASLPARSFSLRRAAGFSERRRRRAGWKCCLAQDSLAYWPPVTPKSRLRTMNVWRS